MFEGEKNWRLIKDSKRGKYCFLIGVNNWAIELKRNEFQSLYFALMKIKKELVAISSHLMDEELINLEIEQLPWYLELDGNKSEWNLRLVFETQEQTRSFEMYWPIPIAQSLFYEIKNMWESMD